MRVQIFENAFERDKAKLLEMSYQYGTVKDFYDRLGLELPHDHFVVIVSGKKVDWDYIPCADDEIIYFHDIKAPAFAALFVLAGMTAATAAAVAAIVAPIVISLVVGLAVGMITSMLFSPSAPAAAKGFDNSKTYGWDGVQNIIGEGSTMPVVYGRHRIGGAIIEEFITNKGISWSSRRQSISMLMAMSEGPIEDIVESSIKINKQPISQYKGVSYWTRKGLLEQNAIDEFSNIKRHYNISGVKLTKGNPAYYTTHNEVNAVNIFITSPSMFHMNKNGSLTDAGVNIEVYAKNITDPDQDWVHVIDIYIQGKTRSRVNAHGYHLVSGDILYRKRVKYKFVRTTDSNHGTRHNDDTYLAGIEEVEFTGMSYPRTALLGVKIRATDQISGATPNVTAIVEGRLLRDVRNLDAAAEYNNNPANILYDILTNRGYGLGKYINPKGPINNSNAYKFFDMASFCEFADYCDDLVTYKYYDSTDPSADSDGYVTTTEKRFRLNMVLDARFDAFDMISKICATCRAAPLWIGNRLKIIIERDSDPVQLFSMGNIVKDSYEERYVSLPEIPNCIQATILDQDADFGRLEISRTDPARWDEPSLVRQINLYGLTKVSRASRECIFALKKAYSIRRNIKWAAGMDAVICQPGDKILFQHNTPKYGESGGEILAINRINCTVKLSEYVKLFAGKEYSLLVRTKTNRMNTVSFVASENIQTDTLTFPAGTVFNFQKGNLYAFGEFGKETREYRIVGITRKDNLNLELTAENYDSSVFDEDGTISVKKHRTKRIGTIMSANVDGTQETEEGDPVDPTDIVDVDEYTDGSQYEVPPEVLDVTLSEVLEQAGDVLTSNILVSFGDVNLTEGAHASINYYQVIYSDDEGVTWNIAGNTTDSPFMIRSVNPGNENTYYVLVKPFTNAGVTNEMEHGDNALLFSITPTGQQLDEVAAPSNLVATATPFGNVITWDEPDVANIKTVQIWCATGTNDRDLAVRVGARAGEKFNHADVEPGETYYYWVRTKTNAGEFSDYFPESSTGGVSCALSVWDGGTFT